MREQKHGSSKDRAGYPRTECMMFCGVAFTGVDGSVVIDVELTTDVTGEWLASRSTLVSEFVCAMSLAALGQDGALILGERSEDDVVLKFRTGVFRAGLEREVGEKHGVSNARTVAEFFPWHVDMVLGGH